MKRQSLENIENFNKITAALFALLYEHFPKPIMSFSSSDLCATMDMSGCEDICKASIEFLESEGFLTYTSKTPSGAFGKIRLTLKGLSTLQKIPKALEEKQESLGMSLVQRVKEHSWQIASNLVTQALGGEL